MQKSKFVFTLLIVLFFGLSVQAQQIISESPTTSKQPDKKVTYSSVDNMPIFSPTERMEMPCLTIQFHGNMPVLSEEKKKKLQERLTEFCNTLEENRKNQPEFLKNLKPKKRTGMDLKLKVE